MGLANFSTHVIANEIVMGSQEVGQLLQLGRKGLEVLGLLLLLK